MKKLLIVPFLFLSLLLSAIPDTLWVATWGSDGNVGDSLHPFYSWQKGFNEASTTNDTIIFRGGVWYPTVRQEFNPSTGKGSNGTYGNPVVFMTYPGETPILDCTNYTTTGDTYGMIIANADYVKFKGLTVRNNKQRVDAQWVAGIEFDYIGTAWLENVVSHGHGGYGIRFIDYDTIYATNCDSYDNFDNNDVSGTGNRADGFSMGSGGTVADSFKVVYITGCRAWLNSDDAFESGANMQIQMANNWSFCNGRGADGEGESFKATNAVVHDRTERVWKNNLAAFNKGNAITQELLNNTGVVGSYFNNTVYKCRMGTSQSLSTFNCATDYTNVIYVNNLFYANTYSEYYDQGYFELFNSCGVKPPWTQHHNTWKMTKPSSPWWQYNDTVSWAYTGKDAQFIALPADSAECLALLSAPRQADGSLPDIGSYFQLAEGSDLIDAGYDVGLPFSGTAPDLGAFEYGYDETATDILSYYFTEQTSAATIDDEAHTVDVEVVHGTDVSALTPTFVLSPNATSDPASGVEDDFTSPVTVTVTAADEVTEQEWTVTITLETLPRVPTVATTAGTFVNVLTGTGSGNVISDGGDAVTARGIVWSTSISPTISDNVAVSGSGTGTFTVTFTILQSNTTYYIRAYATNGGGTSYGDQISFTTPEYGMVQSGSKFLYDPATNKFIKR